MRRWAIAIVFAILAAPAANLSGQQVGVPEGSRVRVTFKDSPTTMVGTANTISETGLILDLGSEQLLVPLEDIGRLEKSLSRQRQTVKGLGFGALAGVLVGVISGGETVDRSIEYCTSELPECVSGYSRAKGGVVGLLLGGAVGGGVGFLLNQDEWAEVSLTPTSFALRFPLF